MMSIRLFAILCAGTILLQSVLSAQEAPPPPGFGLPITGGADLASAVPIEFNRDYKPARELKLGERQIFYVDLVPGMELVVVLKALGQGGAAMSLRNEDGRPLRIFEIARPHGARRIPYRPARSGRFFIELNASKAPLSKDQVVFNATLVPFSLKDQAGCGYDAGDTVDSAQILEAWYRYDDRCLGAEGDERDLYGFWGEKGGEYALEIEEERTKKATFRVRLFSETSGRTIAETVGAGGKATLGLIRVPEDDNYFFEVSIDAPEDEIVFYTVRLIGR